MMLRLAAAFLLSFGLLTQAEAQRKPLNDARLEANGDVKLSNDLRLGTFIAGRLSLRPDALTVGGMKVQPETEAPMLLPITSPDQEVAPLGRNLFFTTSPTGRTRQFHGQLIAVEAGGAGVNGPKAADFGQQVHVVKKGFPSKTAPIGEIDPLGIKGRQSGPTPTNVDNASDMDGILVDVGQYEDPGYAAGAEIKVTRTEGPTFTVSHDFGAQIGINDPWGKNSEQGVPLEQRYTAGINRLTYVFGAVASVGELDRAFYSVCSATGTFQDYLMGGSGTAPDIRIKGCGSATPGAIQMGPNGSSFTLMRGTGNALVFLDAGSVQRFSVSQSGVASAVSYTANGQAGVSCSGPPTANFQVTNGIVTRC